MTIVSQNIWRLRGISVLPDIVPFGLGTSFHLFHHKIFRSPLSCSTCEDDEIGKGECNTEGQQAFRPWSSHCGPIALIQSRCKEDAHATSAY
jgi:hypothetical protein